MFKVNSSVSLIRRLAYAAVTAVILQSVWISRGFGTGREVVEFIVKYRALGRISLLVSAVAFSYSFNPVV